MNTSNEIYKTTQSKIFPQIYVFDIWNKREKGKKDILVTSMKIQGIQNLDCGMIHSNIDGSISIVVLPNETLEFDFGDKCSYTVVRTIPRF